MAAAGSLHHQQHQDHGEHFFQCRHALAERSEPARPGQAAVRRREQTKPAAIHPPFGCGPDVRTTAVPRDEPDPARISPIHAARDARRPRRTADSRKFSGSRRSRGSAGGSRAAGHELSATKLPARPRSATSAPEILQLTIFINSFSRIKPRLSLDKKCVSFHPGKTKFN